MRYWLTRAKLWCWWALADRDQRQWVRTVMAARSLAREIKLAGGPDLNSLSDEELVELLTESAKAMARAAAQVGITAQQAADAMIALGRAIQAEEETA